MANAGILNATAINPGTRQIVLIIIHEADVKIAIAGKGGTGKTTIVGTLARVFARQGRRVLAIDADSNPNLALTLGLSREETAALMPLPRTLLEDQLDAEGKKTVGLRISAEEIV